VYTFASIFIIIIYRVTQIVITVCVGRIGTGTSYWIVNVIGKGAIVIAAWGCTTTRATDCARNGTIACFDDELGIADFIEAVQGEINAEGLPAVDAMIEFEPAISCSWISACSKRTPSILSGGGVIAAVIHEVAGVGAIRANPE
jgi:hypothetical protein